MIFIHLTTRVKNLLIPILLSFLFIHVSQAQLLVKDIHTTGNASPEQFVEMNNIVYFAATDATNGEELWRSDGTDAGTYLVKDIRPGAVSSAIDQMTVVNSTLFFEANDGTNGAELWVSDGTPGGTTFIDINTSGSSSPDYLVAMGSTVYFAAANSTNGKELWKSDGTVGGTVEVKNIRPLSSSSSPKYITVYNSEIYFQANDGTNGTEVWKSDGTNGGTTLLKDIRPGGSAAPANFATANSKLFFVANDGTNGKELWVSDGTTANTSFLKDINPLGNSSPANLYEFNNTIYFSATDGSLGFELWTSDGTPAGTTLLKDICTCTTGSYPGEFYEWNSALYFAAASTNKGTELWKTDGTAGGTELLLDIYSGNTSSSPAEFTSYGGKLFFTATDGTNGKEVWMTDGTLEGTQLAMDVYDGATASGVTELTVANSMLFFAADDGNDGSEMRLIGNCDPELAPIRKEVGTHYSLFEKDSMGWTHYCDCANNILLSVEKGATGVDIPTDGVSVKIEASPVTHHVSGCGTGCFITATSGAVVFNRSWNVSPTTQPSSDIPVRFYFSDEEYDAVNAEMVSQSMIPLTDPNQMSFFKVIDSGLGDHPAVEDIEGDDALVLTHDGGSPATPSISTWVKTDFGTDYHAEFLVSSFSGGGGGAGSGGEALPVEMMYFWARPSTPVNEILLEWATASEINNYGFFIERSFDSENWQIIGFADAQVGGGAPNVYHFVDENPASGDNYYRLRQRDYDGGESFSKVAHVEMDLFIVGNIFPNPVTLNSEVLIDITTPSAGPASVQVYDITRQLLIQNQHDLQKGPQLVSLDTKGLSVGVYIVTVESRGVVVNTKLLIQE